MREFVIENEDEDDNGELTLKAEMRREMIGKLAQEWNKYNTLIERMRWIDEDREDEDSKDEYYVEVNKRACLNHERMVVIEELLSELGARMMRPYEHWNEDERYMEYMETRYDNDPW